MENLKFNKAGYLMSLAMAMMIPVSTVNAALISSASDASLAGANVIDFTGTALGVYTAITVEDVTFTAANAHLQIDNTYQAYNQQGIYLDNGTYNDNGFSSLRLDFAGGTDAFGFTWGMAESFATWTLAAYDASNTLIESYILPSTGASSAGEFYGISAAGASYATLSWSGSYDWVAIDNVTYTHENTAAVPEPGTLALFGLGLAGLAVGFKRKKTA
jgi:hypothetical protein